MIDHIFPLTSQRVPDLKVGTTDPNLEISNLTTVNPSMPNQERRKHRRAKISLRMRLRSADFSDGQLKHIAQTVNTSRRGFYFHTEHDRFHEGMRLRILVPYHEHLSGGDSEEIAEVVRVDRKAGHVGVAVMRCAPVAEPRPSIDANVVDVIRAPKIQAQPIVETRNGRERRIDQRSALIATVEMTDTQTGMISRARTSDLSMTGCFIDTLNPLPLGTTVALSIQKGNEELKVQASVCTQFPGSGMGVAFETLTPEQCELVKNWMV
jgi:hypothetical protein